MAMEVITPEQIQRTGATTLDEALMKTASIYVPADGDRVSIRGARTQDAVFLVNGRRITGTSGRGDAFSRIPLQQVERVEIVKGPGSVLYGSDALGGVINVVTRSPQEGGSAALDVNAGLNGDGEGGLLAPSVTFSAGDRDTRWRITAGALNRDAHSEEALARIRVKTGDSLQSPSELEDTGIRDTYSLDEDHRASADLHHLQAHMEHWVSDRVRVGLEAGLLSDDRERRFIQTDLPVATAETDEEGRLRSTLNTPVRQEEDSRRQDLSARVDWMATQDLDLSYRIDRSRFRMDRHVYVVPWRDMGFARQSESDFGTRQVTFTDHTHDLMATWSPATDHRLQVGVQHLDREYEDRSLSQDAVTKQWLTGVFMQHQWAVTPHTDLVYGVRHDDTSESVDNTALQAGMVHRLTPGLRLRAHYAEGFKIPEARSYTVHTRDPRGRLVLGSDVVEPAVGKQAHDLDPERSRTLDLGVSGHLAGADKAPGLTYEVGVFETRFDDLIAKTRGDGPYLTFQNIQDARIRGLETVLQLDLPHRVQLGLNATWLEAMDRDTDRELTQTPDFIGVARLGWAPVRALQLDLRVRGQGERYVDAANTERDQAYALVDLAAVYRPPRWQDLSLRAGIDNLMDRENDTSLYADPGRFFRVGARYRF
ncbi:MAG: TonB-dependent receptor plug domain-containing protein [Ectothiorhodospira sp.]